MVLATLSHWLVYTGCLLGGHTSSSFGALWSGENLSHKNLFWDSPTSYLDFQICGFILYTIESAALKARHWWYCSTTLWWTGRPDIAYCSQFPAAFNCGLIYRFLFVLEDVSHLYGAAGSALLGYAIDLIVFALYLPKVCTSDDTLSCFQKLLSIYYCFIFLFSLQWNFGREEW